MPKYAKTLTFFVLAEVGQLEPVPEMDCLRLVVSRPGAIETLRGAA